MGPKAETGRDRFHNHLLAIMAVVVGLQLFGMIDVKVGEIIMGIILGILAVEAMVLVYKLHRLLHPRKEDDK